MTAGDITGKPAVTFKPRPRLLEELPRAGLHNLHLRRKGSSVMEGEKKDSAYSCEIKLRENPKRLREKVYIGCGAGFGGDRPLAALKLLQRVKELDYLVLECLAERTLADRYQVMMKGGKGFDPRTVERGVCLVTNMGATGDEQLTASEGVSPDPLLHMRGVSTYLGAALLVQCLEKYKPHVIITSRVADAALFLGPMMKSYDTEECKGLKNEPIFSTMGKMSPDIIDFIVSNAR
ncbi:hypothetical protein ACLOJK_015625 [Asimina triloba]